MDALDALLPLLSRVIERALPVTHPTPKSNLSTSSE
jgi:hypothetical protein